MFPEDSEFEYMSTYGKSGTCPSTQIKTFPSSGFYVLRSGWDPQSTVLIHSNNVSLKLGDSSHNHLTTVHLSYIVTDVTSFPIPVFVHIWQRIMRRLWSYADGFVRPKHITQWF